MSNEEQPVRPEEEVLPETASMVEGGAPEESEAVVEGEGRPSDGEVSLGDAVIAWLDTRAEAERGAADHSESAAQPEGAVDDRSDVLAGHEAESTAAKPVVRRRRAKRVAATKVPLLDVDVVVDDAPALPKRRRAKRVEPAHGQPESADPTVASGERTDRTVPLTDAVLADLAMRAEAPPVAERPEATEASRGDEATDHHATADQTATAAQNAAETTDDRPVADAAAAEAGSPEPIDAQAGAEAPDAVDTTVETLPGVEADSAEEALSEDAGSDDAGSDEPGDLRTDTDEQSADADRSADQPGGTDQPSDGGEPHGVNRPADADQPGDEDQPNGADRPNSADQPNRADRPGDADGSLDVGTSAGAVRPDLDREPTDSGQVTAGEPQPASGSPAISQDPTATHAAADATESAAESVRPSHRGFALGEASATDPRLATDPDRGAESRVNDRRSEDGPGSSGPAGPPSMAVLFQPPTPPRRRRAASRPAGPPIASVFRAPSPTDSPTGDAATGDSATGDSGETEQARVDRAEPGERAGRQAEGRAGRAESAERPARSPKTAGRGSGQRPAADQPDPDRSAADVVADLANTDSDAAERTQPETEAESPDRETTDREGSDRNRRKAKRTAAKRSGPRSESPADDEPEAATDSESAADVPADSAGADESDDDQPSDGPRRRRRRGGRGRRRRSDDGPERTNEQDSDGADDSDDSETGDADDSAAEQSADESVGGKAEESDSDEPETGSRRRRRRRRSGSGGDDASTDDPPNTVTKVRQGRRNDEVTGVQGSTRLEAKRQRRREGRESGRRRQIITEAEFLARRESVERTMLVREKDGRTQLVVLEDDVLVEHYVARKSATSMIGNIYLGRVQNVLPSMEAAFVDIGRGRNAVLYAGEVNWDAAGLHGGSARRIELALKSGDSVLVQVSKDPIGHKGARLTSQISLPGRYLVYVPGASLTGISRKLPYNERNRLKKVLRSVVPEDAGVIVRTAAEGASEEELKRDVERLRRLWADVEKKAKTASPASLLHGEPELIVKVVRDIFNEDFKRLVVAGEPAWSTIKRYVDQVAPDLADRVERWDGEDDLFEKYRVDEQVAKGLERKVWLPSGGSLVIDRTEAMTVIDVNTGKFVGSGGNLEETVTRNNLEAAEEIVRQLRLRDIGGIVVIDFIDMVLEANRDLVLRRLVECLGRDRTKHQVAEVTSLGLVQMTRKRVGQGLLESFSEPCEACGGRGVIVHSLEAESRSAPSKPEPRRHNEAQRVAEAARKAKERAAARAESGSQPQAEGKGSRSAAKQAAASRASASAPDAAPTSDSSSTSEPVSASKQASSSEPGPASKQASSSEPGPDSETASASEPVSASEPASPSEPGPSEPTPEADTDPTQATAASADLPVTADPASDPALASSSDTTPDTATPDGAPSDAASSDASTSDTASSSDAVSEPQADHPSPGHADSDEAPVAPDAAQSDAAQPDADVPRAD